jgi:sporulation protein YlmC with PRC-barrel domain
MRKALLTTSAALALLIAPALAQDALEPQQDPLIAPEVTPPPGDDMTLGETPDITDDATAVAEGPKFIGEQENGELLASSLIGQNVYSRTDETLGQINDLIFTEDNGTIRAVVVGVGGFLGIGQKNVAVSFEHLVETTDADGNIRLVLDATHEELEAAPAYVTLAELRRQQEMDQMQQLDPMPPLDPMP